MNVFHDDWGFETKPYKAPSRRARVIGVIAALITLIGLVVGALFWAIPTLGQTPTGGTIELPTDRGIEGYPSLPESVKDPETGNSPLNILLIGTDTRGDMDTEAIFDDDGTDMRSDTMILMHVSADRKRVSLVSLMRDLWVRIPGVDYDAKLNAAFAIGGAPRTVATVETLVGRKIDHVAIIDFAGFKSIVDSLGGVDVNNPQAFESSHLRSLPKDQRQFEEGPIRLDGERALAFVRERYAFATADYMRTKLQRAFLRGVWGSFRDASSGEALGALLKGMKYVETDKGMTVAFMTDLAVALKGATVTDGIFPTAGTGMEGDQSVVYVDPERADMFQDALRDDLLDVYLAENPQNQ